MPGQKEAGEENETTNKVFQVRLEVLQLRKERTFQTRMPQPTEGIREKERRPHANGETKYTSHRKGEGTSISRSGKETPVRTLHSNGIPRSPSTSRRATETPTRKN